MKISRDSKILKFKQIRIIAVFYELETISNFEISFIRNATNEFSIPPRR